MAQHQCCCPHHVVYGPTRLPDPPRPEINWVDVTDDVTLELWRRGQTKSVVDGLLRGADQR